MAWERLGAATFGLSGADPSATTMDVPAGTDLIVACSYGWNGSGFAGFTSVVLEGDETFTLLAAVADTGDLNGGRLAYLRSPTTGDDLSIDWVHNSAASEGPAVVFEFWSGCDPTAAIIDSDNARQSGGGSPISITLTGGTADDLIIGFVGSFTGAENPDGAPAGSSGQTVGVDNFAFNSDGLDTLSKVGGSSVSVLGDGSYPLLYCAMFPADAGGGAATGTVAPVGTAAVVALSGTVDIAGDVAAVASGGVASVAGANPAVGTMALAPAPPVVGVAGIAANRGAVAPLASAAVGTVAGTFVNTGTVGPQAPAPVVGVTGAATIGGSVAALAAASVLAMTGLAGSTVGSIAMVAAAAVGAVTGAFVNTGTVSPNASPGQSSVSGTFVNSGSVAAVAAAAVAHIASLVAAVGRVCVNTWNRRRPWSRRNR